ncbi:PilW family protein [Nitrincola tapanii]|uniref:Prepilin-type N-terminal cleavage/methylation domain-containing protein n=1 Tax=Nitrincola tapanii TaxID=1708751 RepID=A0A5A9W6D6_9GAMM|nr:prepilin-type N-terminal cleavage/methylation domain-containing protein [Nitrincola tapanii]KAA0876276.1 prepilin-type N-terminal cleavage/methylation domain-containing protein [Nitrincola tapanii]
MFSMSESSPKVASRILASTNVVKSAQAGFTLVELLVALVIGVFLIGGALAVFQSNQISYRTKVELDNAQEAFRYMSYTLTRLTKSAANFDSASSNTELAMNIAGGDGVRNCLGAPVALGTTQLNSFSVSGGNLQCSVDGGAPVTLVRRVSDLNLWYGVDSDDDGRVSNDEYVLANEVDDWAVDVRTVLVQLSMESTTSSDLSIQFVTSMRAKVAEDFIIVHPDPNGVPAPPPTGNENPPVEEEEEVNPNDPGEGGENGGSNESDEPTLGGGNGGSSCSNVEVDCTCRYLGNKYSIVTNKSDPGCQVSMCASNAPAGLKNNNEFTFKMTVCR